MRIPLACPLIFVLPWLTIPVAAQNSSGLDGVLAKYPELYAAYRGYTDYLSHSELPAADRELLICRIAWLAGSEYEWNIHARLALQSGVAADELEHVLGTLPWNGPHAVLIRAADQLHQHAFIEDEVWSELSARYNTHQLMDLVMTVGAFEMASASANTLRVGIAPVAGIPSWRKTGDAYPVAR